LYPKLAKDADQGLLKEYVRQGIPVKSKQMLKGILVRVYR
jgi:hypothetical protein